MNKMLRFDFLQMGACEVVCYVFLSLVFAAASLRFPHLNPFLKLTPCQLKYLLKLEIYTSGKEIYCYLVTVQSFNIMFIFLLFLIAYNICCVFVHPCAKTKCDLSTHVNRAFFAFPLLLSGSLRGQSTVQ